MSTSIRSGSLIAGALAALPVSGATAPAAAAAAAAVPSLCPATLPRDLAGLDGFVAYADESPPRRIERFDGAGARLKEVRFADGDPVEIAWLVPDDGNHTAQHWRFRGSGVTSPHLACAYANGILLAKPLVPAPERCTVAYGRFGGGSWTPLRVTCRD